MISSNVARFEGRLFAEDGRLCMVVETNDANGTALVSKRVDGKHTVVELSLTEVTQRMAVSGNLSLDNTSGANAKKRILETPEGWFYKTREGQQGPFDSREDAERELSRFIVSTQSVDSPSEPRNDHAEPSSSDAESDAKKAAKEVEQEA